MIRSELKALGLILCAFIALRPSTVMSNGNTAKQKPNVLFIVVDDLNNNIGCYGKQALKTPNIDNLAARGVRFDRAYCQYPLCNPSRTSFLSGLRPETTEVYGNGVKPRTRINDAVFLPEHFLANGYFTARVGKIAHPTFEDVIRWNVSEDAKGNVGREGPRDDQSIQTRKLASEGRPKRAAGEAPAKVLDFTKTKNEDRDEPDGKTARRIVEIMEQHLAKNDGKPFFIAAGFHKPHLPWVCPSKYFEFYPPDSIVLPNEPPDHLKDVPAAALTTTAYAATLSDQEKKEMIAAYEACTSFTDAQVGVLLDAMEKHRLWDNTIVVFIGDHGWHLGEHGLWRKQSLFEESARVPFIVCAPGKPAGKVSPQLVEMVDLYPTLIELADLPRIQTLEGTSFVPLLNDPKQPWKTAAFTTVMRGNVMGRSVRTERYRYTEWGDSSTAQLYDHNEDPYEYRNLVNEPSAAAIVAEMQKVLRDGWKAATPKALALRPTR